MNWYSTLWYWYSALSFIPFLAFTVYRFRYQDEYSKFQGSFPTYTMDTVYRIMLAPAIAYYILDSITIIMLYHRMDMCNLAFLIHHLFTLSGAYEMLSLPYYPWFIIAPMTVHDLLITFPDDLWLNYVYLAAVLALFYGIRQKPWQQQFKYRRVEMTGYMLLVCPIFMLWLFECKNDMMNTVG